STARYMLEINTGERRDARKAPLLVLCGIVVVFLCGFFLWRYFWNYESTDDAQVDAHVYPVSARISGRLIRVNVRDNEYVHKGNVLVEIDPKNYQLAVEQARADLDKAVAAAESSHAEIPMATQNISIRLQTTAADLERAHDGVTAAETQLAAAKAQVEEAEANDSRSKQDVLRYKMLLDRNEVATQT